MIQIEHFYEGLAPRENLTKLCNADDILYFDIETTGLSRLKNHIYLIGVGHYFNCGLKIIQWFAETESEEINVLKAFYDYSSSFMYVVNYNGKSFDIPFTTERMHKYSLEMPALESIDLYLYTKPLKKILSLCDLTQKSIEQFLCISRQDMYNGGELIYVYKKYESIYKLNEENKEITEAFDKLILHNKEDVLNMHYLSDILYYNDLSDLIPQYDNHIIKKYTDYSGKEKHEIVVSGLHNLTFIPKSFNSFKNENELSYMINICNDNSLKFRLPIVECTLNYYINNYKDYYYLPNEDMCILKSMAGGVLKENRENAKKENCLVKLTDTFLPLPTGCDLDILSIRIFKANYKSKQYYIRLHDFENLSLEDKNIILSMYYKFFFV